MDKSPDAFRTISEVADVLDTPAHVLRFWETRFPQIKPVKRAGGRRYYRPSDVALLTGIKRLLHDDGLTIRGVQKILREQGVRHVAGLGDGDHDAPGTRHDPFAIIDDPATDDARDMVAAGDHDALWPDAGLPPPDDDGTLVLRTGAKAARDVPADPVVAEEGTAQDPAETDMSTPRDLFHAAATPAAGAAPADPDDLLIAAVLQTAAPSTTRVNDGWRSLPLAAGEEMPMAARLRALPRGALSPRSAAIAAWTLRARDLTRRMRQGGSGGQDGSPSP
ncbi:MAG: MerR family transcriptional regulator [Pseudomonadota bacterium]